MLAQRDLPSRPRQLLLRAGVGLALVAVAGASCGIDSSPSTRSGSGDSFVQGPAATPNAVRRPAVPVQADVERGLPTIPVSKRRATGPEISPRFFGIHMLHSTTVWPQLPVGAFRLWDTETTWSDLQPKPDTWYWAELDQLVDLATANGADTTITLGQTPQWASARPREKDDYYGPGRAAEPERMSDWRAYVRAVATRYKGRIRAYQVWNEVDWVGMYSGSMRKLAALTRATARVVRAVDPEALVVGPAFVPLAGHDPDLLRSYFRHGPARYLDAFGVHLYSDSPEESFVLLEKTRAVLAEVGAGHLPVWNTEITYGRRKTGVLNKRAAAGAVARAYLLAPYNGVRRQYWYAWDDRDFGGVDMTVPWEHDTPTTAARAYERVYEWMVGARAAGCLRDGAMWSCTYRLPDGSRGVAAWSTRGKLRARVPDGFRYVQQLSGRQRDVRPGERIRLSKTPVLLTKRA